MTPHDPTLMTRSMVTGLQGLLVRTAGGTGEPAGEFSQTEDLILPAFTLHAFKLCHFDKLWGGTGACWDDASYVICLKTTNVSEVEL